MIFCNHPPKDVSFEDIILWCSHFECPTESVVADPNEIKRTGLNHCLESETYWMETESVHVKKEPEENIKTEVDPDGELLVELGGHKYPIDPEFSYGKKEPEIMSEHFANQESPRAPYEHRAVKTEPLDQSETDNDSQLQIHKIHPTSAEIHPTSVRIHGTCDLSLSTYIKNEKAENVKNENYGPSYYSSGTFVKQELSCSSVALDRPSVFYNGHSRDQFYERNISDQLYNNPYDCQVAKNGYCGVTSTEYQAYNMDYQMVIAQDAMSQPTSSTYCPTSSAYRYASPVNMSHYVSQTTPDQAFSTGWSSVAQDFNTRVQYDQQTIDCSRPVRKLKRGCRLWEFIRNLLMDPATNPSLIRWENRDEGTFKLMQSKTIAFMWGMKKGNRGMTYEKLSRAMRYYYKRQVFAPVLGKRLVYKFGPRAVGWKA